MQTVTPVGQIGTQDTSTLQNESQGSGSNYQTTPSPGSPNNLMGGNPFSPNTQLQIHAAVRAAHLAIVPNLNGAHPAPPLSNVVRALRTPNSPQVAAVAHAALQVAPPHRPNGARRRLF